LVKKNYTCKRRKQCTHCCCPKRNERGSHAKGNDCSIINHPENDVTILSPIVDGSDLETEVIREVLAKETKYGIAKNTDFSKELERQNPNIIRDLLWYYKLNRSKKIVEPIASKETSESIPDSNRSDSNYSVKSFTVLISQLVSSASENIGTRYRMGPPKTVLIVRVDVYHFQQF
jgi:hypothetical protein